MTIQQMAGAYADKVTPNRFICTQEKIHGNAVFDFTGGFNKAREWMDISTAPKDGTHVLLLCVGRILPVVGKYVEDFFYKWTPSEYGMRGFYIEPTHWQPLPSPPVK